MPSAPTIGEVWIESATGMKAEVLEVENWHHAYSRVRVHLLPIMLNATFKISWFLEYFQREEEQ